MINANTFRWHWMTVPTLQVSISLFFFCFFRIICVNFNANEELRDIVRLNFYTKAVDIYNTLQKVDGY